VFDSISAVYSVTNAAGWPPYRLKTTSFWKWQTGPFYETVMHNIHADIELVQPTSTVRSTAEQT
jgi:hypothetical protein